MHQEKQSEEYSTYYQAKPSSKVRKNEEKHSVEQNLKYCTYRADTKDSGASGDGFKVLARENYQQNYDQPSKYLHCKTCSIGSIDNYIGVSKCLASDFGSEHSNNSRHSQHSSKSLRKIITSQCKMVDRMTKELADENLYTLGENITSDIRVKEASTQTHLTSYKGKTKGFYEPSTSALAAAKMPTSKEMEPTFLHECHYKSSKHTKVLPKPETMPRAGEADENVYQFLQEHQKCHHKEINISLGDIVQAKIINPLMKKCCRMYIDCMSNEVAIMEDMEHMSQNIDELYKSKFFKKVLDRNDNTYDKPL